MSPFVLAASVALSVAACAALWAPCPAAAAPGDSRAQPLPPPATWPQPVTGRAVAALRLTYDSTFINGYGMSAPATQAVCEAAMAMGLASRMPHFGPGVEAPNTGRSVVYFTLDGQRMADIQDKRLYLPDPPPARSHDICLANHRFTDDATLLIRRIGGGAHTVWEVLARQGLRHTYQLPARRHVLDYPNPLRLSPTEATAPLGGVPAGEGRIAGLRCERVRYPDGHTSCSIAAQPGVPDFLVGSAGERTAAPDQPPHMHITNVLTSYMPLVWVDEGVFMTPTDAPFRQSLPHRPPPRPAQGDSPSAGAASLPVDLGRLLQSLPGAAR